MRLADAEEWLSVSGRENEMKSGIKHKKWWPN